MVHNNICATPPYNASSWLVLPVAAAKQEQYIRHFKEWFWAHVRDGTGSSGMESIFVANTLEVAGNTNDQAL